MQSMHFAIILISGHFAVFLASQDALEVMLFTDWLTDLLTYSLMVSFDFTDVTLVGDDT